MAGTSGGYVTDLNPERAYDVDIRRLDDEEKRTISINCAIMLASVTISILGTEVRVL